MECGLLKDYPKAPVACREVTVNDGVKFAKFRGKVSKVGHHFVQVEILDVADIPVSTIAFQIVRAAISPWRIRWLQLGISRSEIN